MADWQGYLARGLNKIEDRIDDIRLAHRARHGVKRDLTIYPYIGHTNGQQLFIRGRVLLDNNILPPSQDDSAWMNVRNMYKRFESDEIPYARVKATVNGQTQEVDCNSEGFFRLVMDLEQPLQPKEGWQQVELNVIQTPIPSLDLSTAEHIDGRVIVPPEDAQFAIVSDLDDTVVRTDVLNVFKMLRNTILRNAYTRLPFEGVAAFYRALQQGTNNTQNPIFYVSSSPWNLYDVIIDFYKIRNIPLGPVYLRNIGMSREQLVAKGHMQHKYDYIQRLLDIYPHLPFILIGDSGQRDAWIYQNVVENNPDRIQAVYIRNVTRLQRVHIIEHVAKKIRAKDVEMVLVKDTYEAAQHAVQQGYITNAMLPQIQRECRRDSQQASVVERILET